MKDCTRCGCKKEWKGDDPKCPFQGKNKFGDNWNCGHINKIRKLIEDGLNKGDTRISYQYCDNQKYCSINISETGLGLCLWVSWYKSRGRTDAMWVLNEDDEPRVPTFDDLQTIIDYYK